MLRLLEKRFPLTAIGLIVSLAYIGYTEYFNAKKVNFSITILNDYPVFQLMDSVKNLEVLYNKENILLQNIKLKTILIKVKNEGNVNITENMYSSEIPFGIKLKGIKIIGNPTIINQSEKSLPNAIPLLDSVSQILLPKRMLDIDDEYILKILYFGGKEVPIIESTGKISGQKVISIKSETIKDGQKKTTVGPLYKSMAFIGYAAFTIFILFMIESIHYNSKTIGRRFVLRRFKNKNPDFVLSKLIKDIYIKHGSVAVKILDEFFNNKDVFNQISEMEKEIYNNQIFLGKYDYELEIERNNVYCKQDYKSIIKRILHEKPEEIFSSRHERGYVTTDEIDENFLKAFNRFLGFLENN